MYELHSLVRTVLHLHKDEMYACSKPSTTPHFLRKDKVTVVTKNLFLLRHPNWKLRNRRVGPLKLEEQIGKHIYILKLPTTIRLHPMFHVNNLRPYSTSSLRLAFPVTTPIGDEEKFDIYHISHCALIRFLDDEGSISLHDTL
jgi:hypothetical protein